MRYIYGKILKYTIYKRYGKYEFLVFFFSEPPPPRGDWI